MNIELLAENPEYVNCVCSWIYNEFVAVNNPGYAFDKLLGFFGDTHKDKFPITYIALEEGICTGTVSIFENDLKNQNKLTPWLASLYVCPEYRKLKIAEKLIGAVVDKVKELGFDELYLRTEHAAGYYLKRGWEFVYKTLDTNNQETEVYRLHILKGGYNDIL